MGKRLADGTWQDSCIAKAKPEEPIFVLRAQDLLADDLVALWAARAVIHGCPIEKINEAIDTVKAMREWPDRKYPD